MRRLLMKIGLRINRRIFATVIGIAICAAYLVGTISLVEGLHVGADNITSNFSQYPYLVYTNGTATRSSISNQTLEMLSDERRPQKWTSSFGTLGTDCV